MAKDPTLTIQRFVDNLKLYIQTVTRCGWFQTFAGILVSHGRLVPHEIRRVGACKYYITTHLAVVQHIQRNNLRTSTSHRQYTTGHPGGSRGALWPLECGMGRPANTKYNHPSSIPFGLWLKMECKQIISVNVFFRMSYTAYYAGVTQRCDLSSAGGGAGGLLEKNMRFYERPFDVRAGRSRIAIATCASPHRKRANLASK